MAIDLNEDYFVPRKPTLLETISSPAILERRNEQVEPTTDVNRPVLKSSGSTDVNSVSKTNKRRGLTEENPIPLNSKIKLSNYWISSLRIK